MDGIKTCAGCLCFCCSCGYIVVAALSFALNLQSFIFVDYAKSGIYYAGFLIYYIFMFSILITVFKYMAGYLYEAAIEILKTKEMNKTLYKEDQLKTNFMKTLLIIIGNILFLIFLILAQISLDHFILKQYLILYICFSLGFVSSFPLPQQEIKKLLDNSSGYYDRVFKEKTIMNAFVFRIMWFYMYEWTKIKF